MVIGLAAVVGVCCSSTPLLAADSPGRNVRETAGPPVVLMIRAASSDEGKRHEQRLYDELSFALDGFMVMSQPAQERTLPPPADGPPDMDHVAAVAKAHGAELLA